MVMTSEITPPITLNQLSLFFGEGGKDVNRKLCLPENSLLPLECYERMTVYMKAHEEFLEELRDIVLVYNGKKLSTELKEFIEQRSEVQKLWNVGNSFILEKKDL